MASWVEPSHYDFPEGYVPPSGSMEPPVIQNLARHADRPQDCWCIEDARNAGVEFANEEAPERASGFMVTATWDQAIQVTCTGYPDCHWQWEWTGTAERDWPTLREMVRAAGEHERSHR